MNPATHGVLHMALELSNKTWRLALSDGAKCDTAVYQQGEAIVVQPRSDIVYVRYYDPYVVGRALLLPRGLASV